MTYGSRAQVYDVNSTDLAALAPPARTCTNPALPPRPQCQDGLYILDGFLNVSSPWSPDVL